VCHWCQLMQSLTLKLIKCSNVDDVIIIIIIIIIIKYIYIAQDREKAANALGNSYKWNRYVLSLFLNIVSVMSGVCSLLGRLFHTRGPWTAMLVYMKLKFIDHISQLSHISIMNCHLHFLQSGATSAEHIGTSAEAFYDIVPSANEPPHSMKELSKFHSLYFFLPSCCIYLTSTKKLVQWHSHMVVFLNINLFGSAS